MVPISLVGRNGLPSVTSTETKDLHIHDLRHDATRRPFEACFLILTARTGHKDWKMFRRHSHLKPEQLHYRRATKATKPKPPE